MNKLITLLLIEGLITPVLRGHLWDKENVGFKDR
jgi:hypothetical protein